MDSINPQLQADPKPKDTSTTQGPRPLFVYGTLCAKPLLAWALTGNAENIEEVSCLMRPARVFGYKRVAVHHCDYPAMIKDDNDASFVDGFVLQPRTASQRRKLDDFEGEIYRPVAVTAHLTRVADEQQHKMIENESHKSTNDGQEKQRDQESKMSRNIANAVDADIYLWDAEMEKLTEEPWSLEAFISTRLEDWLDLFGGMELVGHDTSS